MYLKYILMEAVMNNLTKQPSAQDLLDAMHSVMDPELGVNVVDLGLVYSAEASDGNARIVMTMTTPACPLHSYIRESAERVLRNRFPGLHSVSVEIVWDPPWSPDMMSAQAKQQLGWA